MLFEKYCLCSFVYMNTWMLVTGAWSWGVSFVVMPRRWRIGCSQNTSKNRHQNGESLKLKILNGITPDNPSRNGEHRGVDFLYAPSYQSKGATWPPCVGQGRWTWWRRFIFFSFSSCPIRRISSGQQNVGRHGSCPMCDSCVLQHFCSTLWYVW